MINLPAMFAQKRQVYVFFRHDYPGKIEFPINPEGRVVVSETAFMRLGIVIVALVYELRRIAEHYITMREPAWHKELAFIFGTQANAVPMAVSR